MEASGLDFGLEALDLGATELTGITLIVQRGESIESSGPRGANPLADLARRDPKESCDLLLRHPLVEPEEGTEAGEDPSVRDLLPAFLDLGTGLGVEGEGLTHDATTSKQGNRDTAGDSLRR